MKRIELVLFIGALLVVGSFASTASAHGGLDEPPTRSYVCRFLDSSSEMCAQAWDQNPQALYDWMEINIGDANGIHEPRIPDGQLCSAGRSKYSALDTPGDWPVTTLSPNETGLYEMSYVPHAPHATEYFRFYLTREGFDATTDSLSWDDLELVHDSGPISYSYMSTQGEDFGFEMDMPERPGRHILYLVWQRSDSPEAFYGCSDVQFSQFSDGTDTPTSEQAEDSEPAPDPSEESSMPPHNSPDSGGVDVVISATSDWGGGYCAEARVTNHGHSEVLWETMLSISGQLTSSWDSVMTPVVASSESSALPLYRVVGEFWNQFINPHESVSFGFCVTRSTPSSEIASVVGNSESTADPDPNQSSPDAGSEQTPEDSEPSGPQDSSDDESTPSINDEASTDPGSSPAGESSPSNHPKPILAAYYPEWGIYGRDYFISDVPASEITHLIYAFVDLDPNGQIVLFDENAAILRRFGAEESVSGEDDWAGPQESEPESLQGIWGNFRQMAQLKAKYPHLKVSVAVGGWTLSRHFSSVLSTAQGRQAASDSVVEFLDQYEMFDGVDFDWEYPGGGGLPENGVRAEDGQNYALFLQLVRNQLDELGLEKGRTYQISVASPGGSDKVANFNLEELKDSVDFFNLMAYDFHGTWENRTGHQAAFEADANGYDIRTAVDLYLEAGVAPEQIVLGSPLYTRAWGGVVDGGDGGYGELSTTPAPGSFGDQPGVYDYKDLLQDWREGMGGWSLYWDDDAGAAYLYSSEQAVFSSMETPGTVAFKSEWAQSIGLGGMMFWDLSNDLPGDPESLIRAAANSWFDGQEWAEIVAASEWQFDYIIGGNGVFDPIVESSTPATDITQPGDSGSSADECVGVRAFPLRPWYHGAPLLYRNNQTWDGPNSSLPCVSPVGDQSAGDS